MHFVYINIDPLWYYRKERHDWLPQNTTRRLKITSCLPLFAIKNRCKISLYKHSREMQRTVDPTLCRATCCGGVTNIWNDRVIQRELAHAHAVKLQPLLRRATDSVNTESARDSFGLRLVQTSSSTFSLLCSCVCATCFNANMPFYIIIHYFSDVQNNVCNVLHYYCFINTMLLSRSVSIGTET